MLCLKKNHTGYCSDENVRERADEHARVDPEDGKEAQPGRLPMRYSPPRTATPTPPMNKISTPTV